jgi:pimeloyl-ACP methyl ester carboxylesterase
MDDLRSRDGTLIRYVRRGSGPPLLLIHGTNADHTQWLPIMPVLSRHLTVYAMIRRGHRGSEDAGSYQIDREIEDIVALADAAREGPVNILAHSYGGICALEAACRYPGVQRLLLYEPPIPAYPGAYVTKELIKTARRWLARNKGEAVLDAFLAEIAQVPTSELAAMRSRPQWTKAVSRAHLIVRELEAAANYELKPERFHDWKVPTLFLLGGDSPRAYRATAEKLNAVLPGSAIAILEGQRHAAMTRAPALFVRKVLAFIKGDPCEAAETGLSEARV